MGAPEPLRYAIERENRSTLRAFVPVALECMAYGGTPDEESLEAIRQSARRNVEHHVPASAALNMIRAADARLTAISMRHATPADAASTLTLMGRDSRDKTAEIIHLYATAYISGI